MRNFDLCGCDVTMVPPSRIHLSYQQQGGKGVDIPLLLTRIFRSLGAPCGAALVSKPCNSLTYECPRHR